MGKREKFLRRIYNHPIPKDIKYREMAYFLLSIGCKSQKRTGFSHRNFKHPDFPDIITLMEEETIKPYQIRKIRELLEHISIVEED
ncbi:hypothetical protein [Phosphitispora sp. TUW77]|uniref:hypothetical protein n=1 Tax=Phosphitispora sp. TUW77 TaxID=3152361 RepID=UPI003AB619F3